MSLVTRIYTFTDGTTAYGSQVDAEIANIVNTLNSLDQGNTTWTNVKVTTLSPLADVSMGGHKVTNLGTPTTSGDAATYPITNAQLTAQTVRGSTANSAATAREILQGSISTPDLRANAVTKSDSIGDSGLITANTLITSKSITTLGGPVLIVATASIGGTSGTILSNGQADAAGEVKQGSNAIVGGVSICTVRGITTGISLQRMPISITAIDSPVAGTYTYNFYYSTGSLTSVAIINYSLTLVELRA